MCNNEFRKCYTDIVETFYWFGDNNHTEWAELFDLYKKPQVSVPNKEGMYSFGMAGKITAYLQVPNIITSSDVFTSTSTLCHG